MLLLQKNQKKLSAKKLLPLILPFLFLAGIWLGVFASQKTDREFDSYTRSLFVSQLSGSTLSLHYTLADPAAWDLDRQEVSRRSSQLSGKFQKSSGIFPLRKSFPGKSADLRYPASFLRYRTVRRE